MINTKDFPNIEKKVNKLVPIVAKYNFEDLASAIYCVGVCINNRSSLESTLALNWALQLHKHTGTVRIVSYAEFESFFESVKEVLKPSPADDAVVEDYGDVYVEVLGKRYSVILGTGHNMVFACLQFLPYLATATKHEAELVEVMEYNSHVIEYLKDVNISDGDYGARFVVPSENLFNRVYILFQGLCNQDLCNVAKIVDSELIEKMHFIIGQDSIIPLANTSLLLDLYDKWYQELDDVRRGQFINRTLSGIALSLSRLERDDKVNFLCPVANTETVEKPVIENVFPFALMSSKGMILAVNRDDYDGNIEGIIKELNEARNKNELHMIETISRNDGGRCRGITVTSQSDIQFLVYDNWANPEETHIMLKEGVQDYFTCTALDIVYYLLFMDDSDELYDYLKSSRESKDTQILGFGGDVAAFFMWKDAGHMFEKGAVHYSLIDVGYDTENEYVVDYFREKLNSFPIGRGDYILDNPFAWNISPRENDFFEYIQKGKVGYGGLFRSFRNGCYFFFPHNVVFYPDIKEYIKYKDSIFLIEDIIQRVISSSKLIIENSRELADKAIQVMMMPESYAKKADPSGMLLGQSRAYVKSDSIVANNKVCIRYVPMIEKLFADISEAKDRSIEVQFIAEMLQPLNNYFPEFAHDLENHLKKIKTENKEVSAVGYKIEYAWNQEQEVIFTVKNEAYLKVRKHIAKVCFSAGISEGTYQGKDATKVVRSIQKTLVEDFETEVKKYDYLKIQELALANYATLIHEIMIHRKRYDSFGDIKESVKNEVSKNIITQREEAKHNARTALYLLETALFIREKGRIILSTDEFQYLLAYANWLVVLNDNADICYYTDDVCVEVSNEYIIDVESNRETNSDLGETLAKRMYDHPGFLERDHDSDSEFFDKVKVAFEEDTQVPLEVFLSLLYYLETGGIIGSEIFWKGNVLCFWKDDLILDFSNIQKCSKALAERAVNLLCIDADKLKTKDEKADFYLPISEKEKRSDRYEVKPVYEYDDMLIYAPSVLAYLRDYWQNSLFEFHMPFEIGMSHTKDVLIDWKRVYEKKIVFDLEKVFVKEGFAVKHNFELMNINKSKYPQYLGDYDLFAVDLENKEIWIIECKVFEKVETFYEMYRQQNRFFKENKFDEKFQRRIDFMEEHFSDVINDLHLPTNEYHIRPYMCVNKVFASRYKKIKFPILCYEEMVIEIENR